MTTFKPFSIVLDLNLFYDNYKKLSRIFIGQDITTIKELSKHIKNVFNIKRFYLTCNGQYLPSSEDIRILEHNNVINVVPRSPPKNHENLKSEQNVQPQINIEVEESEEHDHFENNSCQIGESVKKDENSEEQEESSTESDSSEEEEVETPIETQSHKVLFSFKKHKEVPTITEEYLKNKPRNIVPLQIIKNGNQLKNGNNEKKEETTKKSSVNETESKITLLSSTILKKGSESAPETNRNIPIENINKEEHKEILKNKLKCFFSSLHANGNDSKGNRLGNSISEKPVESESTASEKNLEQSVNDNTITKPLSIDQTESISNLNKPLSKRIVGGIGFLLEDLRTKSPAQSLNGTISSSISNCESSTKRKRVRKRRRKNQTGFCPEIKPIQCETSQSSLPIIKNGSPSIHIRFTEDDVPENCNQSSCNLESSINESQMEECIDVSQKVETRFQAEFIDKQPKMLDIKPKSEDLIAFKIMKISSTWTPELSAYIVGKVISFDETNEKIKINIIDGFDELREPLGKFTIDSEEAVENDNQDREFLWVNLLERRLLYP